MQKLRRYFIFIALFFFNATVIAKADFPYKEEDLIAYKAAEPKTSLLVYTDVSCGFCRKLHAEIPHLNASGISVYYAPFPRAGLNSKSRKVFNSIYCSDDRQKALTKAKNSFVLEKGDCDDPVDAIYEQAKTIGLVGTPSMRTEDGQTINGYKPAQELTKQLGMEYIQASDEQVASFQPLNYANESIAPTYYQGLSRVSLYQLPSHEQKEVWTLKRESLRVATVKTVVDGKEWIGFEAAKYATTERADVFLAPDINTPAVFDIPPRRSINATFEYEKEGIKWLAYERHGITYFVEHDKFSLLE